MASVLWLKRADELSTEDKCFCNLYGLYGLSHGAGKWGVWQCVFHFGGNLSSWVLLPLVTFQGQTRHDARGARTSIGWFHVYIATVFEDSLSYWSSGVEGKKCLNFSLWNVFAFKIHHHHHWAFSALQGRGGREAGETISDLCTFPPEDIKQLGRPFWSAKQPEVLGTPIYVGITSYLK